jgi:hypothetical protein
MSERTVSFSPLPLVLGSGLNIGELPKKSLKSVLWAGILWSFKNAREGLKLKDQLSRIDHPTLII